MLAFRIKETLTKYCLDFQDCRGQGYDGASNMSARRGVQGLLIAENSKATYVHCSSHVLNLCIASASMQFDIYTKYEWSCNGIRILFFPKGRHFLRV